MVWPCLIGSLAERGLIFHISAHPRLTCQRWTKSIDVQLHKINATYLIKDFFHRPKKCARMPFQCELAGFVCRLLYVKWNALYDILAAVPLPANTALVSGPSGHDRLSDGSEQKWLWQGNSHQIPWQLPQQPPLILPCHTHKEITEWV